jgi:hypothetical protein
MEPGRAVDAHMEAWRLKMEPWRVWNFVEEQDQDPDGINVKGWIRIRTKEKSRVRIRFKVMRIRNPGSANKKWFIQQSGGRYLQYRYVYLTDTYTGTGTP